MSDDFKVEKGQVSNTQQAQENKTIENSQNNGKIIDEANYRIHAPGEKGPTAMGRGGDTLYRRIKASQEELNELMEETQTVQDWVQRETSNNVALACLNNSDLKDIYFKMKDGFGDYGKISLMGFKTPNGAEIPRLKIYDTDGEVIEVLTGPLAMDELNKRALAYKSAENGYEIISELPTESDEIIQEIADYNGNIT